ncbi:MAG: diguanylate cyclase [Campylobacterales bacterium]|nr:diguanylate cyclase [Campylobacterales bacterium]
MRYYFIIFIVYEILITSYFYFQYKYKVDSYHEKTAALIQNSFNSVINTFTIVNDEFHSEQADKLAALVVQANGKSPEVRNKVRAEILENFMPFYSNKNLDIFAGMHVFDKDGKSLLRLHQPSFYDDDIIKRRPSLQKMQQSFSYQHGFEIGMCDTTYRYQYPLFYDGAFVGSYEYSVDYNSILKEMKKFYDEDFIILFKATEMEKIVKENALKTKFNYLQIDEKSYYSSQNCYKNSYDEKRLKYLYKLDEFIHALELNRPSVIDYHFKSVSFSSVVTPLKSITGEDIAYIVVTIKDDSEEIFLSTFFMETFIVSLLSLIVYLYILKQLKHRAYIQNLLNIQKDILIVTDGDRIKDANRALLEFFNFSSLDEFITQHECICDFFIEEEGFLQKYNNGVLWLDYLLLNPNEHNRVKMQNQKTLQVFVFEIEFENFTGKNSFILFRDITQEYAKTLELQNQASYDGLTQIYNRSSFEQELTKELEKASRYGYTFSLIMFDIDHFKDVNDTYGHDVGDVILKEISRIVKNAIRDVDFFARWGGEEFMIISNGDIKNSEDFAEKIRSLIENHQFPHIGDLSASFGVTEYRTGDTAESIIKRSDNMLYSAKESGRNCVVSIR